MRKWCLRCRGPVSAPGKSFCAAHEQEYRADTRPIFSDRTRLARVQLQNKQLRTALEVTGAGPQFDVLYRLADIVSKYVEVDGCMVCHQAEHTRECSIGIALDDAKKMGWLPSTE